MTPQTAFTPEQTLCSIHGEPLREHWPRGYSQLVTIIGSAVLADPAFMAEIGGNFSNVKTALSTRPLCCRAPKAKLLEVYELAGIGSMYHCAACGSKRLGTIYHLAGPGGEVETLPHLCFACVVYTEPGQGFYHLAPQPIPTIRPHKSKPKRP